MNRRIHSRWLSFGAIIAAVLAVAQLTVGQNPPLEPIPDSSIAEEGHRFQATQRTEWQAEEAPAVMALIADDSPTAKFAVPTNVAPEELERYRELSNLPAIESFFFPVPESVCFPDDRAQVTDTTNFPWSAQCQLVITMPGGGRAIGTGWLLGPRLVITAGHCVHEGVDGDFFPSVEVISGMNGPIRPFGSQVSRQLRASDAWKSAGSMAKDYGAIMLDHEFVMPSGATPGHHSIITPTDAELANQSVWLSGYPADKDFGSQWTDDDPLDAVQPSRLRYMLDTFGGHSGSAVVLSGRDVVVGIHNYGGCPNQCTRITQDVASDLQHWLGESQSP